MMDRKVIMLHLFHELIRLTIPIFKLLILQINLVTFIWILNKVIELIKISDKCENPCSIYLSLKGGVY